MGSNLAFDTHQFVENLIKAKMPKEQAEVLATEYANILTDRLATKDDLKNLEQRLDAKIGGVEQRLDAKIDGVEQRLDAKIENVKDDIKNLEQRLDTKIDGVKESLEKDMRGIELNLTNLILKSQIVGVIITITVLSFVMAFFMS
jgi:predicted PurR-regulated permease PerM